MTHSHHSESSDSTPPMKISRSTWVSAPIYVIIAVSVTIAAAVMAYANLLSQDSTHGTAILDIQVQTAKHEERIFKLEQSQTRIEVMQNDIAWIRKSIESEKNNMPRSISNPGGH